MVATEHKAASVRNQTEKAPQLDRRQKKTRRAIYQAFESLMSEEHYSQVTVAQVIARADIGRSTFYAHFETKDDLLGNMCVEMFDHIFAGVNEQCVTHPGLKTTSLSGKLAHLLYHLRDTHSGICGKLVREGEPHFTAYFERCLAELFEREGPEGPTGVPAELAVDVAVAGFSRVVSWWFAHGATQAPEDMARWFCALMWE